MADAAVSVDAAIKSRYPASMLAIFNTTPKVDRRRIISNKGLTNRQIVTRNFYYMRMRQTRQWTQREANYFPRSPDGLLRRGYVCQNCVFINAFGPGTCAVVSGAIAADGFCLGPNILPAAKVAAPL